VRPARPGLEKTEVVITKSPLRTRPVISGLEFDYSPLIAKSPGITRKSGKIRSLSPGNAFLECNRKMAINCGRIALVSQIFRQYDF
jgi:hypothetical protein